MGANATLAAWVDVSSANEHGSQRISGRGSANALAMLHLIAVGDGCSFWQHEVYDLCYDTCYDCAQCAPGTFSTAGSPPCVGMPFSCIQLHVGYVCLMSTCCTTILITGEYQDQRSQGGCKWCPDGQYSNGYGSTRCWSCAPGRWRIPISRWDSWEGVVCRPAGNSGCWQCSPGLRPAHTVHACNSAPEDSLTSALCPIQGSTKAVGDKAAAWPVWLGSIAAMLAARCARTVHQDSTALEVGVQPAICAPVVSAAPW
jgi:hypothetical protein